MITDEELQLQHAKPATLMGKDPASVGSTRQPGLQRHARRSDRFVDRAQIRRRVERLATRSEL